MLSQKISKAALILEINTDPAERQAHTEELQKAVTLWQSSHFGLQHGNAALGLPGNNSDEVKQLFGAIEPNYEAMLSAAMNILLVINQSQAPTDRRSSIAPFVQTILANESDFLVGMDKIVSQYQTEAEGRVTILKTTELTLLGITLLVLLVEGSFIFR